MGFLPKKRRTLPELEEEKERLTVEEEVTTKQAEIAEREAVISELRKKYGSGWAKTLGISKLTDLSTLRSFLVSAKKGLEKQAYSGGGSPVSRLNDYRGITKA